MKIAIISDCHLGFGSGTEREQDPFTAFKEALEKAQGADAILIPGDLFDAKVPTTETLTRAMELLLGPKLQPNKVKVSQGINKNLEALSPLALSGTPVVAIHGTHERRIKGFLNPVEALEKAGFLVYLHCNGIVLEKDGEKVCVQGMGGVPEHFAASCLKEWGSKPLPDCCNILLLHQNLEGCVNAPHTLPLASLPEGFDLLVCGHLHEPKETEARILIAGSLVPTQLTKEATKPRGFWLLDTRTGQLEFQELENQRAVYHLEFDSPDKTAIEKKLKEILSKPHQLKPLVRIKIKGKEAFDFTSELQSRFDQAILSFKKELAQETKPRARDLEAQKLSVQELGRKLLQENLTKAGLDPRTFEAVFELLEAKKSGDALEVLRSSAKEKQGQKGSAG